MLITGDTGGEGYIRERCTFCSIFFKRKPTLKTNKQTKNTHTQIKKPPNPFPGPEQLAYPP